MSQNKQQLEGVLGLINITCSSGMLDVAVLSRKIEGWLSLKEATALFLLAQHGPGQGAIVEIGSFKGKSTVCLAVGSKNVGREKVVAIDPHRGELAGEKKDKAPDVAPTYKEFLENLNSFNVSDWVEPKVMTSVEAAKNWATPVRLLFIDGIHEYDYTKEDFLTWEPHVISGGIITFHDYGNDWDGPRRVVEELIKSVPGFQVHGAVDTLYIISKV